MSRRALLSPEQRIRLFGIPVDQAEMARHYVLSVEDLALVRAKRRVSNRLGFAVQLCVLRYPGRALDPVEAPPVSMLSFVANQIGTDPGRFGDYARRGETRRQHLIELQKLLHLRSRLVRPQPGPQIAVSQSFMRCSPICAPPTYSFPQRQYWSGSDLQLGYALARKPSRLWRMV